MNESTLLLLLVMAAVVVGSILLKQLMSISPAKARELIQAGAVVVDVRSVPEFRSESIPGVVNVPLDEVESRIEAVAPDKTKPVLLHCKSGGRSAMATSILKRKGYTQVHNLGSFSRARQIVSEAKGK